MSPSSSPAPVTVPTCDAACWYVVHPRGVTTGRRGKAGGQNRAVGSKRRVAQIYSADVLPNQRVEAPNRKP